MPGTTGDFEWLQDGFAPGTCRAPQITLWNIRPLSGQGEASVSGDQAPVLSCECSRQMGEIRGMSAPENRVNALQGVKKSLNRQKENQISGAFL